MTTILQIEDNYANRVLIERILEPHDYQLLNAETGQTGIAMALEHKPDLILMDMGLPDIDGQTVVTHLRQTPGFQKIIIIALTAWPPQIAEEMARRYGCDGCITKPINVKQFPDQISHYLEKARLNN